MPVDIQTTPLVYPFVASAVVTISLTVYGVVHLRRNGMDETTLAFVGIVSMVSVWTLARVAEYLFVGAVLTRLSIATLYIGYGGSTLSVLFFALAFTGRTSLLTRKNVGLLLVIPTLAIFVAGTNSYYHEFLWAGEFVQREGWYGTITVYDRAFQPLFHAYLLYTVGAVLVGLYFLLRLSLGSPDVYRRQTVAFATGAVVALVFAMFFVAGRQPFLPDFVDITPVGFAIMGLCFGYAIFRYSLLDLVPVARDTVIEHMRDGYVVLDGQARIVDLNPSAASVLDVEDAIGTDLAEVFPEGDTVLDDHAAGTRTEAEVTFAVDGEHRFYNIAITPLSEGETRIGTLLLLTDVTSRRAVRKRYQALIENTSDIILVVDRDEIITYASPSVESIAGVDEETVIGQQAFDLVHPEDRAAFRDLFERLLENPGERFRQEYRTWDAEGNLLYLEGSVWNLLDNSYVEGFVVNARDITARKRRESELEDANRQLTAANEQLEQFASVISHDLRNPINVAKGHLELAAEGREESFDKMDDSLDRMEAIIEDVLALAQEGQAIGDPEPVDLATIAEEAWEHVATREATLTVDETISFLGDVDRLLQLFENLFRNAREHGGDDVTVTVGLEDGTLFVEDDGPGIPDHRRDSVLEYGHTTADEGTGLGLSIVSQIAEAHGWEVSVTESTAGGARFEFDGVETADRGPN